MSSLGATQKGPVLHRGGDMPVTDFLLAGAWLKEAPFVFSQTDARAEDCLCRAVSQHGSRKEDPQPA